MWHGLVRHALRPGAVLVAAVFAVMAAWADSPGKPAPAAPAAPATLDLRVPRQSLAPHVESGRIAAAPASLARSIALTAHVSLIDQGIEASRQALIDCQKGDYPGGGMGLLSLPFQNASAQTGTIAAGSDSRQGPGAQACAR